MKSKLVILIVFLISIPFLVLSQSQEEIRESTFQERNEIFIQQIGTSNQVNASLDRTEGFLLSNAYQKGELNIINLNLKGENILNSLLQNGNSNSIGLDISGSNIRGVVVQSGNNNVVERSFSSETGGGFHISQYGDGHQVLQQGPSTLNGLEIRQQGLVGMTAIISNN